MFRIDSENFWMKAFKQFTRDRYGIAGLVLVIVMFLMALFSPILANDRPVVMKYDGSWYFPAFRNVLRGQWFIEYEFFQFIDPKEFLEDEKEKISFVLMPPVPYSPLEIDLDATLAGPGGHHWFGTDEVGRDVLSRMIHGTEVSLLVGFVSTGIALILGVFFGSLAGFYRGWVDTVVMRLIEIILCFPRFFIILAVIAFLPPSIYNIMMVIGLFGWPGYARQIRAEFFRLREMEFTTAARALGARDTRLVFRHLLPNSLAPVLVIATFGISSAILTEASLSFLGFGIQPPTPSWGGILSKAKEYIEVAPWLAYFPGLAIFITMTAYNLVGEAFRDATDPRIAGR